MLEKQYVLNQYFQMSSNETFRDKFNLCLLSFHVLVEVRGKDFEGSKVTLPVMNTQYLPSLWTSVKNKTKALLNRNIAI